MHKSTASLCALSVVIAAATLGMASPASAVYKDTSMGGACHAANGGAANKFTYNNNYLTNIGTIDQYVVCHFAMSDASTTVAAPTHLTISAMAGGTAATVSCTAQEGSFYLGTNHIVSSVAQSLPLGAGGYGYLTWDASLLTRTSVYNTFTLSCKVPAGFKMGLIEYWE